MHLIKNLENPCFNKIRMVPKRNNPPLDIQILPKSDTGVAKIAVLLSWVLSGGLVFHERSKHINVYHHFIRECLDDRRI